MYERKLEIPDTWHCVYEIKSTGTVEIYSGVACEHTHVSGRRWKWEDKGEAGKRGYKKALLDTLADILNNATAAEYAGTDTLWHSFIYCCSQIITLVQPPRGPVDHCTFLLLCSEKSQYFVEVLIFFLNPPLVVICEWIAMYLSHYFPLLLETIFLLLTFV